MKTFESIENWKNQVAVNQHSQLQVGFVPTMGALHEGHLTLVRQALRENDHCVVSIFLNPTQFNDPKDLQNYPADLDGDLRKLKAEGVDSVFLPKATELYIDDYRYHVDEKQLSMYLCGDRRPGHFRGVLTVVLKLLNLVQAQKAYFGEKDFQQLTLIKGMCEAFFIPTQIIGLPTVRESDGLAMSSRNTRLNIEDRNRAPLFFKSLKEGPDAIAVKSKLTELGFKVDYVKDVDGRRFGAIFMNDVRLIDNVSI